MGTPLPGSVAAPVVPTMTLVRREDPATNSHIVHGKLGRSGHSERRAAAAPKLPAEIAGALKLRGLHAQLEAIVALFVPSAEELEARKRVIACVTEVIRAGTGARALHCAGSLLGVGRAGLRISVVAQELVAPTLANGVSVTLASRSRTSKCTARRGMA